VHAVVAGDRRTVGRTNDERRRATQSFNPWGFRRTTTGQSMLPWATVYGLEYREHTRDGFTGHESLDFAGLIHMGGRVYDPATGRFLSPDPVVQAPHDGQNYNRYTYAFNNPLAYTDPTGHWSRRHQQYLRTAVAIAITAQPGPF
jgi:RHS repeat-associated protein